MHPGYGFLSENTEFAMLCKKNGIIFIGPTVENIRQFGLKVPARELAQKAHVPLLPGTGLLSKAEEAVDKADAIGYPVMLKSTAGGGGIGIRICENAAELRMRLTKSGIWQKQTSTTAVFFWKSTFAVPAMWRCRFSETNTGK